MINKMGFTYQCEVPVTGPMQQYVCPIESCPDDYPMILGGGCSLIDSMNLALTNNEPVFCGQEGAGLGGMCHPDWDQALTNNDGCELGTTMNDSPIPGQVNADRLFGIDTWTDLGKVDGCSGSNGDLTVGGDCSTGTWSITSTLWDDYAYCMIVMKDGNATPDTYVSYLLENGDTSGSLVTPFDPNEISHFSSIAPTPPAQTGGTAA